MRRLMWASIAAAALAVVAGIFMWVSRGPHWVYAFAPVVAVMSAGFLTAMVVLTERENERDRVRAAEQPPG